MNKQELVRLFAVATVALPGLLLSASIAFADQFPGSVPKAICGPGDHTESGLQGQTTTQERFFQRRFRTRLQLQSGTRGQGASR